MSDQLCHLWGKGYEESRSIERNFLECKKKGAKNTIVSLCECYTGEKMTFVLCIFNLHYIQDFFFDTLKNKTHKKKVGPAAIVVIDLLKCIFVKRQNE